MKKTTTIQKSSQFYINIPKRIAEKMDIEKGQTALIEIIDKNTIKIQIVEE